MSPREIAVGAIYTAGKTYHHQEHANDGEPEVGLEPTLLVDEHRPMVREVLDIFRGASGEWVAFRLPWGDVRCNRLRSFARWAKERVSDSTRFVDHNYCDKCPKKHNEFAELLASGF